MKAFLDSYGGESANQLLLLERTYRIDSIVLAFERAIAQKLKRGLEISAVEKSILVIEEMEREVNNGGYAQLLVNARWFVLPSLPAALRAIGCENAADLAQAACSILQLQPTANEADVKSAAEGLDSDIQDQLNELDEQYFESLEDIAQMLFDYIRNHVKDVSIPG